MKDQQGQNLLQGRLLPHGLKVTLVSPHPEPTCSIHSAFLSARGANRLWRAGPSWPSRKKHLQGFRSCQPPWSQGPLTTEDSAVKPWLGTPTSLSAPEGTCTPPDSCCLTCWTTARDARGGQKVQGTELSLWSRTWLPGLGMVSGPSARSLGATCLPLRVRQRHRGERGSTLKSCTTVESKLWPNNLGL